MTRLILVRHAQSAPARQEPEEDWPLSDVGVRQAQELVPILRDLGVNVVASSPYRRAIDTLSPFARSAGLELRVDADLRERKLGDVWLPDLNAVHDAVRRMHADLSFAMTGGESGHACLARFEAALDRVAAAHKGDCIAIGSHGGVLGHLLARHHPGLRPEFWRSIRNPHLFFFDWSAGPCFTGEQTLDGSAGVAME